MADFSFWPGRFRNKIARTFVLSLSFPFLFCFLLSLFLSLLRALSLSQGHKNTNAPLILKVLEIIFLTGAKHIMGHFLGFLIGP
jgi:flagellar biosynthesis protein FliQ